MPALVTATPVAVDAAAVVAHTVAVAHSPPPPQPSRLEPSVAYATAAAAAAADAAAADAAADATAIAAAALADGPDGPASQDAHPKMRRRLIPSGSPAPAPAPVPAPAPAPAAAMRALFAIPDAPVNVAPPTGVRTASDLPPAGVPLATVPLLSNANGDGDSGARHLGLDAFRCCCRKDEAAPPAEVSGYAPPDAPQEICRG